MCKKLRMLSLPLLLLSATSCAQSTTETVRTISEYCLIAKGITYSEIKAGQTEDSANKYDTPETVDQIKNHDLAYERVCSKS